MSIATIPVSLSNDGRHVMYVTCRWSIASDGAISIELVDFGPEFRDFCRLACGIYSEQSGVWTAADGFRINRLAAEDRAMAMATAFAQRQKKPKWGHRYA